MKSALQIKKSILDGESGKGDGIWHIQLRTDKKPREYKFVRVITIPEGAGAFAAYRFDMKGDLVELLDRSGSDMLAGRVAVLDLGAGTGDTYQIFDGNLNPDAIAHATDDKAGVINNLLKPILTEVLEAVPQAKHLTTAHIDSYLRSMSSRPALKQRPSVSLAKPSTLRRRSWQTANGTQNGLPPTRSIRCGQRHGRDCRSRRWMALYRKLRQTVVSRPPIYSRHPCSHIPKNIALFDLNGVGQLSFRRSRDENAASVETMKKATNLKKRLDELRDEPELPTELTLKIDRNLHRRLKHQADQEQCSLTGLHSQSIEKHTRREFGR